MKNNNGFAEILITITIALGVIILIIAIIATGYALSEYAHKMNSEYKYEKAITSIDGEKLEIDIDTWNDYNGVQLQIIGKDGKVYLVSSFNTILIGE